MKLNKNNTLREGGAKKRIPLWKPLVLLLSCVIAVLVYRVAAYYVVTWMFWVYFAALFIVSLGYVFYNRGFSRWTIKPSMLPANWSEEKKQKFFEDSNRWKRRSAWMLYVVIPLVVTYIVDFLLILWEEFTFRP